MKKTLLACCMTLLCAYSHAQNIVQLEYFLDSDAGFGQNTIVAVTPAADGSFPFTVNLNGVAKGYHLLYTRTKDSDGIWSHTSWHNIEVVNSTAITNISGAEYFFDNDPGVGNGAAATFSNPAPDGSFSFRIPTGQFATGSHKLYLRARGSDTAISLTAWKDIAITISASGIAGFSGQDFRAYPNPSNGMVRLEFPQGLTEPVTVRVTDALGRLLQQGQADGKAMDIRLDYPAGSYFLTIGAGGESVTKTITLHQQ